jgi:hypothetical protein
MHFQFTLLSLLLSSFLNAQECYWEEAIDQIEFGYHTSDYGLKDNVKTCTRTHETKNEKGEFEIIHGVWGDHLFIEHLNFNEKGNLVSSFEETNIGDTMVITLVDYDKLNRIAQVNIHSMNIWSKHKPFPGENWDSRSLKFVYQKDKLVAIETSGRWGDPYNGNRMHRLNFEYKKGKLVKKVIERGIPARDTLNLREYHYLNGSELLDKIRTTKEGYTTIQGTMKYHYASDEQTLVSKSFTPDRPDEMTQTSYWNFDAQKNLISYARGDSLQDMWYCQKEFKYNELNDMISEYTNMEYDGRARLVTECSYQYDERNNWTVKNIKLHHYISYGGGSEPDQFFRASQVIVYY